MPPSRYELSEAQWERIRGFLPGRKEHVGRTAADNRVFVNGVLWVLRSGARWHDLPERYGKIQERAQALRALGSFRSLGSHLRRAGEGPKESVPDDRFNHRAGSPAGGHGPQKGGADKALGRSRGGLTTKIHLLANQDGQPIDFRITAGQVNDCTQAVELLAARQAEAVIADKGYDSDSILTHIEGMNAEAVIPSRRCRKRQRQHNQQLYKQRNRIERCFSRLKQFRRLATRYEKSKICFKALVALACSWLLLQLYVDAA